MKQYAVLDPSLLQVSQGDTIYPVNEGMITMPVEIARDLVESGQLVLASNLVVKAEPNTIPETTTDGTGKSAKAGKAAKAAKTGDTTEVSGEQA